MADGFESARSEAYFYGGMKDRPTPRRIRRIEKTDKVPSTEKREEQNEKTPLRNG